MGSGSLALGDSIEALTIRRGTPFLNGDSWFVLADIKVMKGPDAQIVIPAEIPSSKIADMECVGGPGARAAIADREPSPDVGEWFTANVSSHWATGMHKPATANLSFVLSDISVQPYDTPKSLDRWEPPRGLDTFTRMLQLLGDPDDLEATCNRLEMAALGCAVEDFDEFDIDSYMASGPNKVDAVARKTVEYNRDYRDAWIYALVGSDSYMVSVWTHAQMANVAINTINMPSETRQSLLHGELRPKAEARLAALHRAYSEQGNQMTWYTPPSSIRTENQFRYARQRAIENSRR